MLDPIGLRCPAKDLRLRRSPPLHRGLKRGLIHPRPARSPKVTLSLSAQGDGRSRTLMNGGQHCWKACCPRPSAESSVPVRNRPARPAPATRAAQHRQLRRPGQGQHLRGILHQVMQLGLRLGRRPARGRASCRPYPNPRSRSYPETRTSETRNYRSGSAWSATGQDRHGRPISGRGSAPGRSPRRSLRTAWAAPGASGSSTGP